MPAPHSAADGLLLEVQSLSKRFGGVAAFGAAKALKPMDSSAGNAISVPVLRRKWRRVVMGKLFSTKEWGQEKGLFNAGLNERATQAGSSA